MAFKHLFTPHCIGGLEIRNRIYSSGHQPVGSLNFNLGWRINEILQLSFDARNLLNEETRQSSDHDTQLWRITERDRSIALTLRAKW